MLLTASASLAHAWASERQLQPDASTGTSVQTPASGILGLSHDELTRLRERPHYPCRCFPAYVEARAAWDRRSARLHNVSSNADSKAAAEDASKRFQSATPPYSDRMGGSGVCLHILDPDDDHTEDAPWLGCVEDDETTECPDDTALHTRSCAEINARWNYLWPLAPPLGWIMAPYAEHECAWVRDAGSNKGDPCPQGGHDVPNKVSTSVGKVLEWQEKRGTPIHNEVIVRGNTFVRELPWAIAAFFVVDCAKYNQSWKPMLRCFGEGAPTYQELVDGARHMQSSYQRAFPFRSAPAIVSFNGEGFEPVLDDAVDSSGRAADYAPGRKHAAHERWRAAYAKSMGQLRDMARIASAELERDGYRSDAGEPEPPLPPASSWPAPGSFAAPMRRRASQRADSLHFQAPLFSDGMILQRGGARVWGGGAVPGASVTIRSATGAATGAFFVYANTTANSKGLWEATIRVDAVNSTYLEALSEGVKTAKLRDVAFGDVLLCGGQSNMGLGMCAAETLEQTPQQALDALPRLRFYKQYGYGPGGGFRAKCDTSAGEHSRTKDKIWFKANASNAGGASALCLETAAALYRSLGGAVPVGAVEAAKTATLVGSWSAPAGDLWKAHMEPLVPMQFKAVLWDQGEEDAMHTNSTFYAAAFPELITGWRGAFEAPLLPFVYVELADELGAEEPKEMDFWLAQREATALPAVGYATTTDLQRGMHPHNKVAVAQRLLPSLLQLAYGWDVVSRGPELVGVESPPDGAGLTLQFSNASLVVHAGGPDLPSNGCHAGSNTALLQKVPTVERRQDEPGGAPRSRLGSAVNVVPLNFSISGATLEVACDPALGSVWLNSDAQQDCFLYSEKSGLPAPPLEIPCGGACAGGSFANGTTCRMAWTCWACGAGAK